MQNTYLGVVKSLATTTDASVLRQANPATSLPCFEQKNSFEGCKFNKNCIIVRMCKTQIEQRQSPQYAPAAT